MKMKKNLMFVFSLLMIVALLASMSLSASAAGLEDGMSASQSVNFTGEYDKSVFLAGETVGSTAGIKGIAFAAGNAVDVAGESEYVMAAGRTVSVDGKVGNDAFAAGYSVIIPGEVERDAYVVGNDVTVTGSVGRLLYAAGSVVTIDGKIGGDVYVNADSLTLGKNADIGGKLSYNSSANVSIADGSSVADTAVYTDAGSTAEAQAVPASESAGRQVWNKVTSYLGVVALAFVLLWLTPLWERVDAIYTGAPFGKFASAFGIGFGVLAGVPIAAIILMITQIGLRLAFVLLMLYVAAILAAPVFLGFFLGSLLWRAAMKKAPNYWAELAIGILIWKLATLIPGVSFVVGLVAVPLGLGVVTLLLGKGKRAPAAPAAAETPAVVEALPADAQSDDAT